MSRGWTFNNATGAEGVDSDLVSKLDEFDEWHYARYGEHIILTSGKRNGDGSSKHDYGNAIDFHSDIGEANDNAARDIQAKLHSMGLNTIDEYRHPISGVTEGGHFHINRTSNANDIGYEFIDGVAQADDIAQYTSTQTATGLDRQMVQAAKIQEDLNRLKNENEGGATFTDGFLDKFYRTSVGGLIHAGTQGGEYTFTDDDVDYVKKTLKGDATAQDWVFSNTHSREQLEKLVQSRLEANEREERLARTSNFSVSTLGSIAGLVVGEGLNPINYIGYGALAKGKTLARMIKLGAFNAGLNVADSAIREKLTGYPESYTWAAGVGAGVGVTQAFIGKLLSRGAKHADILAEEADNLERLGADAESIVKGRDSNAKVYSVRKVYKRLQKLAQPYTDDVPEAIKRAVDEKSALIVERVSLGKIGKMLGVDIAPATSVFQKDGMTFFVSDSIKGLNSKGVKGLLTSELGAKALSADAKKSLMDYVAQRMHSPRGLWKKAIEQAVDKASPESVLASFADLAETEGLGGSFSKVKRLVTEAFNNGKMNDADILHIIRKQASDTLAESRPYYLMSDNTARVGDVMIGATNPLNPHNIDLVAKTFEGKASRAAKSLASFIDTNGLNKTPSGVFYHSKNSILRHFGLHLVSDPQQRLGAVINSLTGEEMREYCLNQMSQSMYELQRTFRDTLFERTKKGIFSSAERKALWREVVDYHDYKFAGNTFHGNVAEVPESVKKLAQYLHDLEETQVRVAREGGLLPSDWKPAAGTRRFVDQAKWREFVMNAPAIEGLTQEQAAFRFLRDYARQAMSLKMDTNEQIYKNYLTEQYAKALNALKAGEEMPMAPVLSGEDFDHNFLEWLDKEANSFAYQQIDRGTSALVVAPLEANGKVTTGLDSLPWTKHRIVMDTAFEIPYNNGRFSFDSALRDYDFDFILNRTSQRWAGEIAYNHAIKGIQGFNDVAKGIRGVDVTPDTVESVIRSQGERLVQNGTISYNTLNKEMQVWRETVSELRGFAKENPKGLLDALSKVVRSLSYSQNGANMGFLQMAEMTGTVAYTGFKQLTSLLPGGTREWAQRMIVGDEKYEEATKQMFAMFGKDMRDLSWANATLAKSELGKYLDPMGVGNGMGIKIFNALDKTTNITSAFTSTISRLDKITAHVVTDIRKFAYLDLLNFATGDTVGSAIRKPLSQRKLAVAGIMDGEAFKKHLQRFVVKDGVGLDMNKMKTADPDLWLQCYKYLDTATKRAITEKTIGNKNLFSDKNWFTRCLTQFKSFTFMAANTQTWRIMNSRERDDFLSVVYNTIMSGTMFAGLTYAKAYSKYGYDDAKRRRYIEERTNPKALAMACVLRSTALGSPVSPITDFAEILGVTTLGTFRTTVGRDFGRGNDSFKMPSLGGIAKNTVDQLPAARTGKNVWDLATMPYDVSKDSFTKQDIEHLDKLLPANNHFLHQALLQELLNRSSLPERHPIERR